MAARVPQEGDVLVSKPTATVTVEIAIMPQAPTVACRNQDVAVAEGRRLAQQRDVDAWLTIDHVHFMSIGSFRQER